MKLRLPHRLQAALVAALASVSFTTLSSGTLSAAFFFGSQAFAEEAADNDNPGATIDIGDTNLDAQAAIDEEEGKGEAKEPGSAPINQAGFNGVYGSSDDFDRQSTAEASIDTENVGTADQANYGSTSADLPSDDLGFTSNPYASGSDTSNGSGVDSPVTSFTQAPQIAPTGGYSAAGIGSGSSSNKTTTPSTGGTGSGAGGGSFGSGISLGSVTKAAPTPVILGAANGESSITLHVDSTPNWETGTGKPKTVYEYLYSTFNEGGTLTFDMSLTWNGGNCGQYQELLHVGALGTGFYIAANGGPHLLVGPKNDHDGKYELTAASLTADTLTPITVTLTNKSAGTASVQITLGETTYNMTDLTWSSMNWNASDGEKWKYSIGCGASGWSSSFPVKNQTILNNDIVATYTAPDVDNLVWNGTPESSVWNTDAQNWTKDGEPTAFASGDNATFSSTGNKTVLIQSAISARTVSVSDNYTFSLSGSGALNAHGIDIASGCTLTVQGGVVTTGVLAGSGTLSIASGAEVDNTSTSAFSSVKLSGQGLYVVDGSANMTAGFNSDWTGTVQLKNVSNFNDGNLAAFANGTLSTVELKGVNGWTSQWKDGHLDFDIKLTNNGNNSAWNFNAGASGGNQAITLNGDISGSGTLEKTNNNNQGFVFTGNLSHWNGAFKQNNTATSFITFKGSASEVNAQILRANGTLNVNVGDGSTSFSTRFNKGVQANTFTVNANASATLTKASTLGALAGTGSFTVNSGSEMVSAAGGSIGSVDVQSGTFRLISSLTTAGNFTVASGATLQYNSKLVGLTVGGNLSFATGASLNVGNIEYFAGKSYTLATATGSISYDSASLLSGLAMPTGATNYTLATSESGGTTSLTLTFDGTTPPTKTLHLYVLTGQSNSLGSVKGDPASPATLEQYSTVRGGDNNGILMWNGNMAGSVSQNEPSKNLIVPNEGKVWQTVAPQEPNYNGNNCMGPEYGFAYMMQHKGWNVSDSSDVAIIKGSRDGGGNDQWVKGQPLYGLLLDTVKTAIKNVDTDGYSTIQLDGLMYLQGESNGETPDAANRFSTFITNFKADLQAAMQTDPELAAKASMITISLGSEILGEPASWGARSAAKITTTSSQLYSLSTQNAGWGFVYTHDLDKINPDDGYHVHYDGNSEIAIGARYAYSMAIGQGLDVTDNGNIRVRSQYYGDTFSTQSASSDKDTYEPVSLNDAKAWWQNAAESGWTTEALSNQVAVWDISSANMRNTAQGAETLSADLAVKGIRIEDPYAEDDSLGTNHATITINNASGTGEHALSVGVAGITLQQGNLTVNTNLTATASQTWNTAAANQQNTLNLTGTTSIADGATVTVEGASIVNISTLAGTGGLTVNGEGAVVTLTDKTAFTGATTVTSGTLKIAGTDDLTITGDLVINGNNASFAGNITADTVTLSNIASGQGSFPTYSGTITGKDSITLDNYTVADMNASLVTQKLVAMGGTRTTISNLTLTACEVTVETGSNVTLADSLTLGNTATYSGDLILADNLTIDVTGVDQGDYTAPVALFSTTDGSISVNNLNSIALTGVGASNYYLSLDSGNSNLYLNFGDGPVTTLIWDNASSNGLWDSGNNWHASGTTTTGTTQFSEGDNVQFSSGFNNTVALSGDVNAGTMTIDNDVSVTVDTANHSLTVADLDSVSGSLTKTGSGTATFGGSDADGISLAALSVTGGSVVFAEHVTVKSDTRIEPTNSSSITFHKGLSYTGTNSYALVVNNGITVTLGGTTEMTGKKIGVAAGGTLILEDSASVTASAVYNSTTLNKNGSIQLGENAKLVTTADGINTTALTMGSGSTMTLGGNSQVTKVTGSGTINATGGNLTITDKDNTIDTLNIASGKTVNLNGGGTGSTIATINSLEGAGNISISSGNGNRTYNLTGDLSQWTGKLSQASGSGNMNLNISGTSALNGSIENTATGSASNITVNLTHDMAVNGSINYTSAGPVIVNVGNANTAVAATFTNSVKTSSLGVANAGSTATFKDVLNLAGNATLAGTLVVDSNSATASSISGTISGGGAIVKNGTGTLELGGNNTSYTGNITVSSGTLKLNSAHALGADNVSDQSTRSITIDKGGTIDLNSKDDGQYAYILHGGSLVNNGNADTSSEHAQTTKLTLTDDSSIGGTHKFYLLASGWGNTSVDMGGKVLEKTGSNEIVMWSTNVTNGGTILISDGSLNIDRRSNQKTLSSLDTNINIAKNGSDALKGNFSLAAEHTISSSVAGATMSANVGLKGATTLSADADDSLTLTGVLSNAADSTGSITKSGAGTVTLSGSNSYSGGTTINAGTLVVSNASGLGSGAVTLNSGTLDLTTTVTTGTLSLDGGTLKLAGAGQLTASALALDGNTALDLFRVTGATGTESITLASTTNGITGDLSGVTLTNWTDPTGYTSALQIQGNNLVLTFTPIDNTLIWNGGTNTWDVGQTAHWHTNDDPDTNIVFENEADVKFVSGDSQTNLAGAITAGTMTLEDGANLTVNTNENSLTVTDLDTAGTTSLTKTGTGEATFGGSDEEGVTLSGLKVSGGSAEFSEHVTVGGSERVQVAAAGSSASVEFKGGLEYNGTNDYALAVQEGANNEVTLYGVSDFHGKWIGIGKDATLTIADGAIVTSGKVQNSGTFEKNGAIEVGAGATFNVQGLIDSSSVTNRGTINVSGGATHFGSFDNDGTLNITYSTRNATIATFGGVSGEGDINITGGSGGRTYNFTGDISDWTGTLTQTATSGSMNLNISGTEELNANILNEADTSADCVINLNLKDNMTVGGSISYTDKGPVHVNVGDAGTVVSASFTNDVKVGNFNMANAASSATLQGSTEIGKLSGAGSLTVDATGKVVAVNGATTDYTGAVAVTSGTLRTGADNALGTGAVTVGTNGTLDVYGHALGNAVTVNGGTLTNGSATDMGVDTPGLANLTVGATGMTVNGGHAVSVNSADGATMTLGGDVTIDGAGTQLVLGDATLSGTGTISTTNSGTLGLGDTTIASGSTVSIGSVGAGANIVFYDTLENQSANTTIYGSTLTYVGDVAANVEGGTYKDTIATEQTGNGFLTGGYHTLIDNTNGGSVSGNLQDATITANGFKHTLTAHGADNDIVFELMEMDINSASNVYFVNTGTVVYNDPNNATGLDRVSSVRLNGGDLTLAGSDLKTEVTLDVEANGKVNIGTGRSLYEETVNVDSGTLTLTGEGSYVMRPCTLGANASLPQGIALGTEEGSEFTGTVWLSNGTKLSDATLVGLVNGSESSVTFNGVTGNLAAGEIAQNINLVDYNSIPALALTYGTNGQTRTFSGTITGDGTLARSYVNGDGNKGGIQNYEFTGDVSNWNGIFDNQVNGETTNLTFSGAVTEIGATIMNGPANSAGTLNVSTAGGDAKVFKKDVTASSFSAQGGNVDFMEVVNLTGGASASGGTVLTFRDSASIGGTLSGNVRVEDGGNVTVAGAATLGSLTLVGTSTTRLNGDVSASGSVTVGNNASLYLNHGGIALGNGASLTVENGAKVGLTGWSASTADHTKSGVKTTGFTGGQLFSVAEGGSATVTVNPITIVMKDGAEFKYTDEASSRVKVYTSTDDGDKYGTVDIIDAVYYYVASPDNKSMDNVIAEAAGSSLDYILIDNGGTLSGVTDDNKSTYGISGLQGGGTIAVGTGGTLTDSAALEAFAGNILVGPNSTFETNGSVARTLTVNGGTLHATDNMILGEKATFTNSGSGESLVIPTVDVDAGKTLEIVKRMSADLKKTGDGTLRITDTYPLGSARQPMISGDLVVTEGTVVLNSLHRTVPGGDNRGIVAGNITMAGGTDLVCEGIDPLGHSGTKTQSITLEAGTEDNLTTMLFTRNGGDSETIQHLTLSTPIYVEGNTLIGGLNLNSFGTHNEEGLGEGSYIHASGTNNVIDNTFTLRKNAYFDVDPNSELTLTGDMLKFTGSASVTNPMVIKTGEGLLDLAGENTSLYAINTKEGEVDVSGHVTFTGTAKDQFLMDQGAVFAVNNGGLFEYRDWDFENNDGTPAPGTITAMGNAQNYILQNADLEVSGMKLTNHNGDAQTITAKLTNVQLVQNGGAGSTVTVADAKQGAGTQHISKLTAATGTTVLNNATLDSATVSDGATLTLTEGKTVTLGSTIRNGGTVNLNGTVNVENLAGFAAQSGAGYEDDIIHPDEKADNYNGFYQGSTYYLVKEEGTSTLDVSENFSVKYQGNDVYAKGQESDHGSYYFEVHVPNALYYINNKTADAVYTSADDAGNSMYKGYTKGEQQKQVDTSGIVMNVAGAVLTLASDLRAEVRTTTAENPGSGIVANYNGTVDIQKDVILHQSDLSGKEGVLVALVGEGTFDLDGTTLKSVSSGLTEGGTDQWHGTVRASGTAVDMDAAHMGNVTSTLLFDGVKGTLESGAADETIEYTMKIALQNGPGEGAVTDKALDNTFGSNTHRVFSNSVSGSGDILMTGENASVAQSIIFTGDVSKWVGTEQDAATFETAGQGTTNLKFSGGATEINVDINEGEGSTINLVAGPTVETQVFNGDIKASSLTVEAGANTTLNNTTAISDVIDATAANAKLHVHGTTTADELKVGTGSVSIQNNAGAEMATISTSTAAAGNADITSGVKMQSADGQAILAGTAGEQPVTRVDSADIALQSAAASLKIENLVLADDTMVHGAAGNAGDLVISRKVVQEMSDVNTDRGADAVVSATALTMSGTKDVTMTFDNDKVANLNFYSMCQMAKISGSAGTLVFDFTEMPGYDSDWEQTFSGYGFVGVNFNIADLAIDASDLTVKALTKDADGQVVERIGYYNNAGLDHNGAVVGSVFYFQVPEPTTGTLSLLALAALAARRRRK